MDHVELQILKTPSVSDKYHSLLDTSWYGAREQHEINDYFQHNIQKKEKLLQIADDFLQNKVCIYGQTIDIYEYQVKHLSHKRKLPEVFHKDLRFYWEIYRDRFLYNICLAWYLTKKEAYINKIFEYLNDWQDFTPLKSENERYNGMESAIKIINLSWVMVFCNDSVKKNQLARKQLRDNIIYHASYIYKNYDITIYGLESNHGLSCSVGLIYASFLFNESKETLKWRKMGSNILRRALKNQFTYDGVNYESSVQYHRFVFELLMLLLALVIRKNNSMKEWLLPEIEKIGNSLIGLTHTNNLISRVGDSDGGKLLYDLGSENEFNDLSYLKWFSGIENHSYETLIFSDLPALKGMLKPNGSRIIHGNYASVKTANFSLIGSCNPIGTNGKGNHQHNDFGAFELYSISPFIVDPWSFCYTGDKYLRNTDRSTASHNTILLDNSEVVPFEKNDLFEFRGFIKTSVCAKKNEDGEIIEFTHNGYHNLPKGKQLYTRIIAIDNINSTIHIKDIISGKGNHDVCVKLLIPQKYWKYEQLNSQFRFYNTYEEFTIKADWASAYLGKGWCSELFLNKEKAFALSFQHKYNKKVELELSIKHKLL